jgi:predicted PurR-regulated permease PerM
VGYLIVGLPHAFVLALLTAAAGLVPSLGSGIVWLPVSAVLAVSGRVTDGVIVFAIGSIAGAADNFIRPVLSRFGRLHVPTFVLFCAMLGGVIAFGASGIIIGPLFVRLAMEGLRLWRRRHAPLVLHPSALNESSKQVPSPALPGE